MFALKKLKVKGCKVLYLFEPWAFVTPGKCIEYMQYIEIKFTEILIKSLSTFSQFIDSKSKAKLHLHHVLAHYHGVYLLYHFSYLFVHHNLEKMSSHSKIGHLFLFQVLSK